MATGQKQQRAASQNSPHQLLARDAHREARRKHGDIQMQPTGGSKSEQTSQPWAKKNPPQLLSADHSTQLELPNSPSFPQNAGSFFEFHCKGVTKLSLAKEHWRGELHASKAGDRRRSAPKPACLQASACTEVLPSDLPGARQSHSAVDHVHL